MYNIFERCVNGKELKTDIKQRQCLTNLSAVLDAAGSSIDNVVKVNIFLTNMENFAAVNKVYTEFINKDPKPVRTVSYPQPFISSL